MDRNAADYNMYHLGPDIDESEEEQSKDKEEITTKNPALCTMCKLQTAVTEGLCPTCLFSVRTP